MKRAKRLLLLTLALTASCRPWSGSAAEGRPVSAAYGAAEEIKVLDVASPLRPQKRVPVLAAPEVFAAYVPAHASGDLMIGDHWIFFKLRESEWFFEKLQDPDPPACGGEVPPEALKPLETVEWPRAVIPTEGNHRDTEAQR